MRPEGGLLWGCCIYCTTSGEEQGLTQLFSACHVCVCRNAGPAMESHLFHQPSPSGHLVLSNTAELYRRAAALPSPSQSGGQWCQERLTLAALPACYSSLFRHQPSWASEGAVRRDGGGYFEEQSC